MKMPFLLLAATLAGSACAIEVTAPVTNTIDGVEVVTWYTFDVDDGHSPMTATLTRLEDAVGDVTIKNIISFGGKPATVTKIAEGAVADNPALLSCTIPNSIVEIGAYAFTNCEVLAKVSISHGTRYIGERAFANTAVTDIELSDTVIDMGGNISAGTLYTAKISIGDNSHFKCDENSGALYNLDGSKLYACPTRAEGTVTLPGSLTNVCADAFFGCHRLTYLNIPAAVTTIGSGAFNVAGIWPGLKAPESTPKLMSVFFNGEPPDAPEDIFNGAPAGLTVYAFKKENSAWNDLTEWKGRPVQLIDSANPPVLSYVDGTGITWYYRIVKDSVEIYNEDASGAPTTAVSPASTTGIGYKENEDSDVVRMALKVPGTINGYAVTKIGAHAFDGCKALVYVGIPSSVGEIGDSAFKGCDSIVAIGGSDAVPFGVEENAVVLPRGVKTLGKRPFEGVQCSSFSFPYTLSSVGGNPLAGCAYASVASVNSDCPKFKSSGGAIYDKSAETLVAVPANGSGDSFTVPATVTKILSDAFAGCSRLKSIAFDGNAPEADADIFADTPETAKVLVNAGSLGWDGDATSSALPASGYWRKREIVGGGEVAGDSGTDGTWTWTVETGVATLTGFVDTNASGTVAVPSAVTDSGSGNKYTVAALGDRALAGCRFVDTVTLPSTLVSIGAEPFSGSRISTVTIPAYVESLGGNPGAGCERFSAFALDKDNVDFKVVDGSLYDFGGKTLLGVPARATSVDVPASVAKIAKDAFDGCASLAKVTFAGDAPEADDGIYADTPDSMTTYVSSDSEGFTEGTWKGRAIVIPSPDDPETDPTVPDAANQTYDDGTVKWTYDVVGGKAVVTGADGDVEGKVVTIPASLDGFALSKMKTDALDGLVGVRAYAAATDAFTVRNGCLYSATGKTLVRVPNGLLLPYYLTTEVSSNLVTITTIPGLKESGNSGNDGTSVTTNLETLVSVRSTEAFAGDISFETLLSGVTGIADHAFYGCNVSLVDETSEGSLAVSGETGFIGAGENPYIRTVTLESRVARTYVTTFELPESVKTVAEGALDESNVAIGAPPEVTSETTASGDDDGGKSAPSVPELAENENYLGWIVSGGRVVGTVAVKTGKTAKGAKKVSGTVTTIGAKKSKVKSEAELRAISGLTLVRDLSKSKSSAEKSAFDAFGGKCWTMAYLQSGDGRFTTLSVSVGKRGKAKVKVCAGDGTKFTATVQMAADGDRFVIPFAATAYSGKLGGIASMVTVGKDGSIQAEPETRLATVAGRVRTSAVLTLVDAKPLGGTLGSAILVGESAAEDGYELDPSLKGWKPRLTKSTGEVKGNVYFYRKSDGKRLRATVCGVLVDGTGYCTATVRNAGSWPVLVVK